MPRKWDVRGMTVYPDYDGRKNVVNTVDWKLTTTDGENKVERVGTTSIPYDPAAPFTPYNRLKEPQVIDWVKLALGDELVALYEQRADKAINAKQKAAITPLRLPWSK